MTDRYNPQHGANMVDRYIGSAFDIVYAVYKQLDSMPVFLEFMQTTSLEIEAYHSTILEKFDQIVLMETSVLDAQVVVLDAKEVASQAAADALEYRNTVQQLINEAEAFKQYVADVIENSIDPLFVNVERIKEDSWANRETLGGLYTHYVREDNGTPVANAECAVYVENSGVLATGLKDKFGQPLANPFVSDADGLVQFVADPGMYTLEVSFDLVVHTYSVYFADEKVRSDLADPAKGASMVAYLGGTVKSFLESLGSAAFEDVTAFATPSELSAVAGEAEDYTDALRSDIADASDPTKGASLVGYQGDTLKTFLESLGSAAFTESSSYATAAQGGLADTAVQPEDLVAVATSGEAVDVAVSDAGGYYASEDVEGALQEVGVAIGDIGNALDVINGEVI